MPTDICRGFLPYVHDGQICAGGAQNVSLVEVLLGFKEVLFSPQIKVTNN